ncbi:E3 ubiquitin-protein ligase ubr3 isoform X3 [Nematostella vectensis]|uniref:E3 ubiquitin-protein ligase ubr3 isoform X3 n=1 Tax=Nematostella vectensis TaxID=45351 RepID=UPI0020778B03|nr:E3 ubiquitin-protein ligase ubr3 isoform X3 [Nematostella vectensis]
MQIYSPVYQLEQVDNESLDTNSPLMEDANGLSEFLITICDTDNMKNVMAECLMVEMRNVEPSNKLRPMSFNTTVSPQTSSRSSMMPKTQGTTITRKESSSSFSSSSSYDSLDEDHRTYLNFMMDFVTKYEFPQRLVTFLLHLLPCKEYKESFTKVFCQHYQMIARALVSSDGPSVEQLSNRVVHVSVQLFSNKELAEKMVLEQNLLHVMVKVLHDMVRPALKEVKGGDQLLSYQLVVNCDNRALSHHCYWPIVSDFINILSHKTVAEMFMKNHDLIKQWMTFIQYLTGMNTTYRQVMSHIEFEPTVYFTSFSVELEAASSPLWSFISGCRVLDSSVCLKNMIVGSTEALWKWYKHIDSMPRHGEVTFHLPLHRYLAGFLSVATSHFKMPLHGIIPNHDLLRLMVEHLLQTQAAVCEIRAGRWVRNGAQIRSQVRLYEECQFCNSMVDLDIFMLQVCATFLDPDCFLNAVLERFGIQHWFQFGESAVPTPPCFDAETDITMVEGVLNLIITLLSFRQHLGMNSKEIIRKEMVAQLCMSDRTHSQLVDLIPDKPGQSHKVQDFETILAELADYKAPGFECGWMQQGMYTPKDEVWENEFDFTHVVHRAIQRQDIQSAMSRYCTFMSRSGKTNVSSSVWPPFHSLKPLPKGFEGLLKLLHCKTLHGLLFYIFHKASLDKSVMPEAVLYMATHLTSLALDSKPPVGAAEVKPNVLSLHQTDDIGSQIVSRCIDYLDVHGENVKGLHQVEDLRSINQELLTRLYQNPSAPINPEQDSCHDVCVVMAHALHHVMQPKLFNSFLPFMAEVLTSALNNQSNTQEKVSQLQHIQYLLEMLPAHRQRLVRKLTGHLVSVSERYNIPTKNLVLVSDDTQPLELSMLLMYLVKYHDWLFRVHSVPPGWPRGLPDLDFPSESMVDNVRHKIGLVIEPVPMITDSTPSTPQDLTSGYQGASVGDTPTQVRAAEITKLSLQQQSDTTLENLIKAFIAITEAPEHIARSLLRSCRGDLSLAINMHLNMEETMPDLEHQPSSQPEEVSSMSSPAHPVGGCVPGGPDMPSSSQHQEEAASPTALNESLLSLLVKQKLAMQESASDASALNTGSGLFYINKLLEKVKLSSPENAQAVAKLLPDSKSVPHKMQSPGSEADDSAAKTLRRQRARERQQKLLAEFASKQKSFLEKTLNVGQEAMEVDTEVDAPAPEETVEQSFECVICGEASPSTEERPVGLVALLQSSAVLRHRSRHHAKIPCTESETTHAENCGTAERQRMDALTQCFTKEASMRASSVGADGGIHIQTCGHYLHIDCQQSYLRSLQEEEAAQLHQMHSFNSRNGEFTCPLCRQLGNCVLPEIPAKIMASMDTTLKEMNHLECINSMSERVKKYQQKCMSKLTACALNFSVLGASVKSMVEIALMLESGDSQTWSPERKFALLYQTARTNIELEQVNMTGRSTQRRSCFGSLMRAFQLHSQILVAPLLSVWSQLTGGGHHLDRAPSTFQDAPLLLRDCPSLLLQFIMAWPAPFSLREFRCLVQLIYNLVFTQALVEACCKFVGDERLSWQDTGKRAAAQEKSGKTLAVDTLLGYVTHCLASSKLFKENNSLMGFTQTVWSPHTVEQSIRDSCLPFLGLASLVSSLCYNTPPPPQYEFYTLASSLGLCPGSSTTPEHASCAVFLSWPHAKPLSIIRKWCDELSAVTRRCDRIIQVTQLLPNLKQWPPPRLLQLPERYDSLIQHYRKQTCPKCYQKPDDPAICLVCGRFTCLQGTCCMSGEETRKFECVQHSCECGAGTGLFLIVLSSVIIIIRAYRVCIWGSVYLDSFGEEDRDLRRGKPLFLSKERFDRLEEQWFTHSFDHTCKRWKRHLNTL